MEEYNIIIETPCGLVGVDNLIELITLLGVDICYYDIEDLLERGKIGDCAAEVRAEYAAVLKEEQSKFLKTDEAPQHYNRKKFVGNLKSLPIKKYDRDGNLIILFHSISAAAEDLGMTAQALHKMMGGIGWWKNSYYYCTYENSFAEPQTKLRTYRGGEKSIQCINPQTEEIVAEYSTIAEACRQTGMPRHRINSLIRNNITDDNGCFWYDSRIKIE